MKRYVSSTLLGLLRRSELAPIAIDTALEDRALGKGSVVLRSNHPLVQHIRQATDITVVQIARRSRYLLLQIEQQKDGAPFWQYRELSPRNCTFSCRGKVPATIEVALNGELLEKLVKPAVAIDGTVIKQVGPTGDGWLAVDVTPPWQMF